MNLTENLFSKLKLAKLTKEAHLKYIQKKHSEHSEEKFLMLSEDFT